jgi:four helix bundle protein
MTPSPKDLTAMPFVALEVALSLIHSLRAPVARIRRHHVKHANQIVDAASSIAANLAEGNRRTGGDRLHLFRVAAGSAAETRVHLQVAKAWGWVSQQDVEPALSLLDRQLRLLHGLTR